jgi:hypothetical protein
MKLLEYDKNLPKQYDKEEFFKPWAKTNFKKTTLGEKDSQISLKTECPVVTRDEIFNVIHKCHLRTEHSCTDTTWKEVKNSYVGISFPHIDLYIEGCTTCSTRKPPKKPIAGKSIMLSRFLTRVQVDLIDMTSRTDNEFRYIMHARDHFSKFSWAYPLYNKTALIFLSFMDVLDILSLKDVLRGQMVTLKLSLVNGFRIIRKDGVLVSP